MYSFHAKYANQVYVRSRRIPALVAISARKTKDYKNEYGAKSQRKVRHLNKNQSELKSTVLDLNIQLKVQQKEWAIAVRDLEIGVKGMADGHERQLLVVHEKLLSVQKITGELRNESRVATNDGNEAMYHFMDALFEPPDHLYIMRLVRKEDAGGLECKRKTDLADFRIRLVAKRQKEIEDLHVLVKVKLVSTVAEIFNTDRDLKFTVKKVHQQLDAFRLRGFTDRSAGPT
ncbi:hypothetical protein C8R44DRAFT_723472 [Mycena epipterygia]|nr:hypothetical protein C8R44DRAFT_723472 [Mycena epipterygia]